MCVNNLPRVELDSGEGRIRTRDLLIASPATTRPPVLYWVSFDYVLETERDTDAEMICKNCIAAETKIIRRTE